MLKIGRDKTLFESHRSILIIPITGWIRCRIKRLDDTGSQKYTYDGVGNITAMQDVKSTTVYT